MSQANYERDASVRVSTVPRLFPYCSSIVPLLLAFSMASTGIGDSILPTNIPRTCSLESGERQAIGSQVLALDDRRQVASDGFDAAIGEEQVPAHRVLALIVEFTGPGNRSVIGKREKARLYGLPGHLQIAVSGEDNPWAPFSRIHAEEVADIAIARGSTLRGLLLGLVAWAKQEIPMASQIIRYRLEVRSWTASADEFHRAAIRDRGLHGELVAVVRGKHDEPQSGLPEIKHAHNSR